MVTFNGREFCSRFRFLSSSGIGNKLAAAGRWFVEPLPDFGAPLSADHEQELFETLLRRVAGARRSVSDQRGAVVGVMSCYRGEGVTTIAMGMARAAAGPSSRKVLIVDANIIQPALHQLLQIELYPGLADFVLSPKPPASLIRSTNIDNLFAISAGRGNRMQVYRAEERLSELFTHIKKHFDLILVDLSPAAHSPMSTQLCRLFDGVVMVVEDERVRLDVARQVKHDLGVAGANILGVVLNKRRRHIPDWLYRSL